MQDSQPTRVQQPPLTQYAILPQAPAINTSQVLLQPQTTEQLLPRI